MLLLRLSVQEMRWLGSFILLYKRMFTLAEDSTLVISDAEVGDSGLYKCHVQNEYGTADSSTVIAIKGRPSLLLPSAIHPSQLG